MPPSPNLPGGTAEYHENLWVRTQRNMLGTCAELGTAVRQCVTLHNGQSLRAAPLARLPPESPIERARGAVPCSIRLRCSSKSVLKLIMLSRAFTNWLQGNNKFNRFIMPRAPSPLPPPEPHATKLCALWMTRFRPLVKIKQICLPPAPPSPTARTLGDPIYNSGWNYSSLASPLPLGYVPSYLTTSYQQL